MNQPNLIIVVGPPASGKTTLSHKLHKQLRLQIISKDTIKEMLFDTCGYKDRAWSIEVGKISFSVFQQFVELYLKQKESVIVESCFMFPEDTNWLQMIADRYQASIIQVFLKAEVAVLRERFFVRAKTARHPGHVDDREQNPAEFDQMMLRRSFDPLVLTGATLVVDTTDFSTVKEEKIFEFIKTHLKA